jgi:hypothetical protein
MIQLVGPSSETILQREQRIAILRYWARPIIAPGHNETEARTLSEQIARKIKRKTLLMA